MDNKLNLISRLKVLKLAIEIKDEELAKQEEEKIINEFGLEQDFDTCSVIAFLQNGDHLGAVAVLDTIEKSLTETDDEELYEKSADEDIILASDVDLPLPIDSMKQLEMFSLEDSSEQTQNNDLVADKNINNQSVITNTDKCHEQTSKEENNLSTLNYIEHIKLQVIHLENLIKEKENVQLVLERFNAYSVYETQELIDRITRLKYEIFERKVNDLQYEVEEYRKNRDRSDRKINDNYNKLSSIKNFLNNENISDKDSHRIREQSISMISQILEQEKSALFEDILYRKKLNEFENSTEKKNFEQAKSAIEDLEKNSTELSRLRDIYAIELEHDDFYDFEDLYISTLVSSHPALIDPSCFSVIKPLINKLKDAWLIRNLVSVKNLCNKVNEQVVAISYIDYNLQHLKQYSEQLDLAINELSNEVTRMESSETYKWIVNIDSWEDYFDNLKTELSVQLDMLQSNIIG